MNDITWLAIRLHLLLIRLDPASFWEEFGADMAAGARA